MKTKTSMLLAVGFLGLTATAIHAQVAINTTSANPDPSAILDLKSGNAGINKGFLPQSVALTNVTVAAPVAAPATGLIVYSSTAPTGGNGTGYYYWDGTAWASMNSTIGGSGIANYVAVWTPNGTTLGTGLIQDNGTGVGVNNAPVAGYEVYNNGGTNTALYATSSNDTAVSVNGTGASISLAVNCANNTAIYVSDAYWGGAYANGVNGYGVWGADGMGDMGVLGYGFSTYGYAVYGVGVNYGIYASGGTAGGYLYDNTGDYTYSGYAGYGNFAYGATGGGYFSDATGDYSYQAYTDYGDYSYGATYGMYASNAAGDVGFSGNGFGLAGYSSAIFPSGAGVYGEDNNDSYGVWGVAANSGCGVDGDANSDFVEGVQGKAKTTDGYPVVGWYNDSAGIANYAPMVWGVNSYSGSSVMMNYFDGVTQWKITDGGAGGSVGTVVANGNGDKVRLICPEAPEVMFEDYGQGQLVSGKAHIDLDPTIAKNVVINEKHPLRAYIQLEGDCNGVYVTNKTATGFDVVELQHGTSNVSFQWHIVCNRADETMNHGLVSHNADIRFPKVNSVSSDKMLAKMEAMDKARSNAKRNAAIAKPVAPHKPAVPANGSKPSPSRMLAQTNKPNTQK